jgi:hypothetical protein
MKAVPSLRELFAVGGKGGLTFHPRTRPHIRQTRQVRADSSLRPSTVKERCQVRLAHGAIRADDAISLGNLASRSEPLGS